MGFTKEDLKKARSANLYDFLIEHYPDDFTQEGNSLRMVDNHSLSIREDFNGYYDFATRESGNSVDFLVYYYGYSVQDAVEALLQGYTIDVIRNDNEQSNDGAKTRKEPRKVSFPKKSDSNIEIMDYLVKGRGIPRDTVEMLVGKGLIYEAACFSNIIFINKERDCAEVRESYMWLPKFRRVIRTLPDRFWWFEKPRTDKSERVKTFITEGAIDAISLYELRDRAPGIYVSICGVANQQAIDRIVRNGTEKAYDIYLAVDNDNAGHECRNRNLDIPALIPIKKDWNEDLRARQEALKRSDSGYTLFVPYEVSV